MPRSGRPGKEKRRAKTIGVDDVRRPGRLLAEFCYDVLFGSFLIRKIQPAITPLLSGVWKDERGVPVRYGDITLLVNGVPIITTTNAQGRFVFRSPCVRPGVHVLLVAGTQRTVRLGTEPQQNLVLVAHPRSTDLHPRTR